MADWGVRGLECFRPRAAPAEMDVIQAHARARGLLLSGGSDWHGSWHGRLGDFYVESADINLLLEVGGL
jgi:hypothetical protein